MLIYSFYIYVCGNPPHYVFQFSFLRYKRFPHERSNRSTGRRSLPLFGGNAKTKGPLSRTPVSSKLSNLLRVIKGLIKSFWGCTLHGWCGPPRSRFVFVYQLPWQTHYAKKILDLHLDYGVSTKGLIFTNGVEFRFNYVNPLPLRYRPSVPELKRVWDSKFRSCIVVV